LSQLGDCGMNLRLRAIGHVVTNASQEKLRRRRSAISKIVIDPDFARGLEGIQDYSHVYVIFWLHETPKSSRDLRVHPRGRKDISKVGVFATRSPHRPNPIGLTLVKLLSRRGRVLTVKGLDAHDGTPILDLKPRDTWENVSRLRLPQWWRKLDRQRSRARRTKSKSPRRLRSRTQ
jgi:tRNA-Thr(GGU) m(6)t(6)A37 methyltransferase TsaA